MKDQKIHREFVRSHIELLTSRTFTHKAFKDVMRRFYVEKHKNRYSRPTPKELMQILVSDLKMKTAPDRIAELINSLPFFRETGEREREALLEIVVLEELRWEFLQGSRGRASLRRWKAQVFTARFWEYPHRGGL